MQPLATSGGLDVSTLLATNDAANNSAPSSAASRNNGGLSFNIPGLLAASSVVSQPIEWDGRNLDDAIQRNPNPLHLMTLFTSPRRPNLLKRVELPQSTGIQVTHFRQRRRPFRGEYVERNHDEIHDRQVSTMTQQSIKGNGNEITSLQQFARHPS